MLNLKVGCLFTGHRRHHLGLIATFRCSMVDRLKQKPEKKTFLSNQPTASFDTHNSLIFSTQHHSPQNKHKNKNKETKTKK
jgi:hypothetical protein